MLKQVTKGVLLSVLLLPSFSQAAEFHGRLGAQGKVNWTNAATDPYYGEGISPTAWSLANERATSEWYPGTFANKMSYDITFSDFAGNEFTTTLDLFAMSYLLGSSSNYFVGTGSGGGAIAPGYLPECSIVVADRNVLSVVEHFPANGCVSSAGFVTRNNERAEPFKFYRPTIDLYTLAEDIQGQPTGRYTASTTLYPIYFYVSESGVLTKTQMIEPIIITIDYVPAELAAVNLVSGDGVMEPVYNKADKRISGQTEYEVEMLGTLPNGAIMNFTEYNQTYEMVSSTEASVKVPYSITCIQGCESADKEIVKDGVFNTASFANGNVISESTPDGGNSVRAKYQISYDVSGDDVISSDYSGQFTVMYEVNL
ncbi:hypothetical protein ACPV47_11815 [Vibrio jasicida]|uniref:hypothetical protein n=1 Tax=Vibrio jasicida TaxID=766224 RepID=UPI0040694E3B